MEKIENYFKKSINSSMDNNKISLIEDIEELYARENLSSNKGIFYILLEAIKFLASDIHIEALNNIIRIRYRINGILKEVARIDKSFLAAISSKIKILSSLDIVEKRKPQDGRFSLRYKGREIDFRTSIMPTMNGEKIVISDKALQSQDIELPKNLIYFHTYTSNLKNFKFSFTKNGNISKSFSIYIFNKEKKVRYKLSFYGFDRSKFLKINSYRKKNNNEINYNNIADYHKNTNEDRESFYKDWRKEYKKIKTVCYKREKLYKNLKL